MDKSNPDHLSRFRTLADVKVAIDDKTASPERKRVALGVVTRFRNAIAGMALTFRRDVAEVLFDGYWMGLSDLPIEATEHAVQRAIRSCKFMPTVAELRELSGELTPEARALRAWDLFNRAVATHGIWRSVDFDDPVVNATVRSLGGWQATYEVDDWDTFYRHRFLKTYQTLAVTGISASAALPLGGLSESQKAPDLIECNMPPHPPGIVPALPHTPARRLASPKLLEAIGTGPDRRFE